MAKLNTAAALQKLKAGGAHPFYFLLGKEKFFQDQFINAATAHLLPDRGSRDLNLTVLYGTENSQAEMLSACLAYPMLAERKIVLVRDFDKMKLSDDEAMQKYLDNPQPTTCLILSAAQKGKTKIYNQIAEKAVTVDCSPIPEYKLTDWIINHSKTKNRAIEPQAAQLLANLLGNNLLNIEQELQKMADFKNDDTPITVTDLEQTTGISKEANVFALQRALARRQLEQSLKISARLADEGTDITQINAILFAFFKKVLSVSTLKSRGNTRAQIGQQMKLRDFQLKDIFEATTHYQMGQIQKIIGVLHEADYASKTSGTNNNAALQMLCYKICRM